MNKNLGISNLNHCEDLEEVSVSGGAVYVNGFTIADGSSSLAYAEAYAGGNNSYTNTQTLTTGHQFTSAYSSYANASANAQTDHERAFFKSTSKYFSSY